MSARQQSVAIEMSQLETSEDPIRSLKVVEVEKKKEKEKQARNDDIALVVCMVILMSVTGGIVMFKVTVIDRKLTGINITTFTPLEQDVHSNMKYIGMGYMPCNGYVPCQPDHLDSQRQRQRIEGAMPCHNYQENEDKI